MTRKASPPTRAAGLQMEATQEWDVDRYQQQHSFVWEYGSDLLDLAVNDIKGDKDLNPSSSSTGTNETPALRILDVGCGSGELTAQLAQRIPYAHVTGLDADPSMVQTASEQFPDVCFVQGDVRDFSLGEDATFDVIFSNAALHWVPPDDMDRAVACLSRALKPGGKLIVEFGGMGNVQTIVEATHKRLGVTSSPWYFPSIADFTTRLESSGGIETTMAWLFDRPTPLSDGPNGLRNWLRMFGNAFWQDLPINDTGNLDRILQDIEEQVRPLLWDGETWQADYRRIRIVGRKL